MNPVLEFREETESFALEIKHSQKESVFVMEDYIDWTVYSATYTEDDYGKEFHRKSDIAEICSRFPPTSLADASVVRVKKEAKKLKPYEFGTIVYEGKYKSYKIQSGGKISFYTIIFDNKLQKDQEYESNLCLNAIRKLTPPEVDEIMQRRQKLTSQPKIMAAYQQLKKENEELRLQNKKMKESFDKKLDQAVNFLNAQIQKQNKTIFQLKQQMKQIHESIQKKKYTEIQMDKKDDNRNAGQKSPLNLKNPYVQLHHVQNNRITRAKQGGKFIQVNFTPRIKPESRYQFTIKIVEKLNGNIVIGVANINLHKFQQSTGQTNSVWYTANRQLKAVDGERGSGFKKGDIVNTIIDRKKNQISWLVNGVQQAKLQDNQVLKSGAELIPFIQMYEVGQSIQWLKSKTF